MLVAHWMDTVVHCMQIFTFCQDWHWRVCAAQYYSQKRCQTDRTTRCCGEPTTVLHDYTHIQRLTEEPCCRHDAGRLARESHWVTCHCPTVVLFSILLMHTLLQSQLCFVSNRLSIFSTGLHFNYFSISVLICLTVDLSIVMVLEIYCTKELNAVL